MSTVLVIGDGRLATEVAELAQEAGHSVVTYLYGQTGPQTNHLLDALPSLLQTLPYTIEIVIEAIIGSRAEKETALKSLDRFLGRDVMFLCATLNASATEAGQWTSRPAALAGWAALPPIAQSSVIELYAGVRTAPQTVDIAAAFFAHLGKTPVPVGDCVGGVLPRLVANLINEAALALSEQVATAGDIDQAMQLGANYPQGPLAWADLIGLNQVMGMLTALGEAYGYDSYQPAPLLRRFVQAGWWGQQSGQGFFEYR